MPTKKYPFNNLIPLDPAIVRSPFVPITKRPMDHGGYWWASCKGSLDTPVFRANRDPTTDKPTTRVVKPGDVIEAEGGAPWDPGYHYLVDRSLSRGVWMMPLV